MKTISKKFSATLFDSRVTDIDAEVASDIFECSLIQQLGSVEAIKSLYQSYIDAVEKGEHDAENGRHKWNYAYNAAHTDAEWAIGYRLGDAAHFEMNF